VVASGFVVPEEVPRDELGDLRFEDERKDATDLSNGKR